MKPLNYDNQGCNPISSNCVIWQGPDIECIKLCKGDSVSVVVFKLAEEFCSLLNKFDITAYDLSCLNLNVCAPSDIQQLIQLLINKICDLEQCCDQSNPTPTNGCPDCIVNICSDFYFTNELGDTITTMQLTDYVQAIGNRVCQLIGQINTINLTLQNHETRITYIEENCCDTREPEFPLITPICVLPATPQVTVSTLLTAVEQELCDLIATTGTPEEIIVVPFRQCVNNGDPQLSNPGSNMDSLPGWVDAPITLADTVTNIWLTLCDMRTSIISIKENCCPGGCDGISVTISASLTYPNLTLFLSGTIPAGFQSCSVLGTPFTFTDGVSTISQNINVILNLNSSINIDVSALNGSANISINAAFCFYDDSAGYIECNSTASYTVINNLACPSVTATPAETTINYTFVTTGAGTFTTQISTSPTFSPLTAQNVSTVPGPQVLSGVFAGLTPGTTYYIRNLILIGEAESTCPTLIVSTLAPVCGEPTDVTGSIVIP
jgi:hypothetical protein